MRPCEESSLTCGAAEDARCMARLVPVAARAVKIFKLNYQQRDFFCPPNILKFIDTV